MLHLPGCHGLLQFHFQVGIILTQLLDRGRICRRILQNLPQILQLSLQINDPVLKGIDPGLDALAFKLGDLPGNGLNRRCPG